MRIGHIEIQNGVLLAPMEDLTDSPFRLLCKRLGADLVYTEFVNAKELLRGASRTRDKMLFRDEERPIGIQIYGGDPESMAEAARRAAGLGPDLIDINGGCWVKEIAGASGGAGAALLRDLPRMQRIVAAVVRAVDVPVTLKTRLGWDEGSIRIEDVAHRCEDAGIQALTVHCRTRSQGHLGTVDHTWIPRLKGAVSIPIIVNGGIESAPDVRRVFETTGCDAVMIGRAAVRDPRIFQRAKHHMRTGTLPPGPTAAERAALLREHLELSIERLGPRAAARELRRHYLTFLRGRRGVESIRAEILRCAEPAALLAHLTACIDLYSPEVGAARPAASAAARDLDPRPGSPDAEAASVPPEE